MSISDQIFHQIARKTFLNLGRTFHQIAAAFRMRNVWIRIQLAVEVIDNLSIGVARGGARAPPNQNSTNDKKLWQHSLTMFSCSFFSVIAHITVIKQ